MPEDNIRAVNLQTLYDADDPVDLAIIQASFNGTEMTLSYARLFEFVHEQRF